MCVILASRLATNVPVDISVNRNGGVSGLTVTLAVRRGDDPTEILDFNDNTFKTSGHVSPTANLADLGGGFYNLTGGLDPSTMVNLPEETAHLILEFTSPAPAAGVCVSSVQFTDIIVAADVWNFPIGGITAGELQGQLRPNRRDALTRTRARAGRLR